MPTLEKYKEKLHKDVRSFSEELQEKFPDAVFTSGHREGAVTKFGKKSRHSTGEAIDLSINPEIANYLNSKDGVALLYKYQLGFLDESTPEGSKFGNSLHIGRDYALVEKTNDKYKELFVEQKQETLTTNVNNLQVAPTTSTFVETETPKDKDVQELKQQTAEYNFMKELKTIPQRELVEQPQTNYLQRYEQVSNFIDNPIAQQGGRYTENELAFLSEIAIKDDMGQYNHPNKITEINSPNITMKGVDYPLLGISKETGETKKMLPNRDYYFGKETKKVIEIPL